MQISFCKDSDHTTILFPDGSWLAYKEDPVEPDNPDLVVPYYPGFFSGGIENPYFEKYYDLEGWGVDGITYEPDNGMYHTRIGDQVTVWENPNQHPALRAIHRLADRIKGDQFIIYHKLYDDDLSHPYEGGFLDAIWEIRRAGLFPGLVALEQIPAPFFDSGHPAHDILTQRGIDWDVAQRPTW